MTAAVMGYYCKPASQRTPSFFGVGHIRRPGFGKLSLGLKPTQRGLSGAARYSVNPAFIKAPLAQA